MKFLRAALAACLLVVLAVGPASAVAAGSKVPVPGKIRFYLFPKTPTTSGIIVTGVIGDYGKVVTVDKNGKTSVVGPYEKVELKQGSFRVDATAFIHKLLSSKATFSKTTCSFEQTFSASGAIDEGTGLYKAIHGTAKITYHAAGVTPRFTSGPDKGQCNNTPAGISKAKASLELITGTAKLNFYLVR